VTCKLSGTEEIKNTFRVLFESWLTTGPYTFEFKFKFVKKVGMSTSIMVDLG